MTISIESELDSIGANRLCELEKICEKKVSFVSFGWRDVKEDRKSKLEY